MHSTPVCCVVGDWRDELVRVTSTHHAQALARRTHALCVLFWCGPADRDRSDCCLDPTNWQPRRSLCLYGGNRIELGYAQCRCVCETIAELCVCLCSDTHHLGLMVQPRYSFTPYQLALPHPHFDDLHGEPPSRLDLDRYRHRIATCHVGADLSGRTPQQHAPEQNP